MRQTTHLVLLFALVTGVAFGRVCAEEKFTFEVSYELQREQYWIDEPIGVEFRIKNTSSKSVTLYDFSGRDAFGVQFECKEPRVLKRKSLKGMWEDFCFNGMASGFDFKPGETISGHRFVNHSYDFRNPGNYAVGYQFYMSYEYEGMRREENCQFKCEGSFKVTVAKEGLTQARLQPILARWSNDEAVRRQVVEALSLVEDPLVIPLLVKYAREAPSTTKTAAVALRRFISKREGQAALEALGKEFGPKETYPWGEYNVPKERDYANYVLSCVFQSFRVTERFPSEAFLREQLRSANIDRVREALEFLMESQQLANQAPVEELERLVLQQNKQLSEQAEKVLEKISKVKVDIQF